MPGRGFTSEGLRFLSGKKWPTRRLAGLGAISEAVYMWPEPRRPSPSVWACSLSLLSEEMSLAALFGVCGPIYWETK